MHHIESAEIVQRRPPNCKQHLKTLEQRFWEKIDKTSSPNGCWIWIGGKTSAGYGMIRWNNKNIYAHRMTWTIQNGPIPEITPYVLHDCPGGDNPACCNPAHLWLGTNADNQRDNAAKGGHSSKTHPEAVARGERHGNAKLTESKVRDILLRFANGEKLRMIVKRFGISGSTACLIRSRKAWRHVRL